MLRPVGSAPSKRRVILRMMMQLAHRKYIFYNMASGRGRARGKLSKGGSSSSSDSSYLCERGLPRSASSWNRQHLESIGIFYDDKSSTLKDITTLLKGHIGKDFCDLPEFGEKLTDLTREHLIFSFDTDEIIKLDVMDEIDEISIKFETSVEEFVQQQKDGLLKDKANHRVFQRWNSDANDFLSYLKIFLARMHWIRYSSDMDVREGCFTQLFMNFMNMCLLKAEIGEAFKGEITVMGNRVSGIPDVRFPCFSRRHGTVEIVTVAEIKHEARVHKDGIFTINHLNDAVLGQHGIELLIERKNSYFESAVSGIICIGSELIFTYLNIEEKQYKSLNRKDVDERLSSSSRILYTRPYNYLDMADRNEILEMCFWLGYLQMNAL